MNQKTRPIFLPNFRRQLKETRWAKRRRDKRREMEGRREIEEVIESNIQGPYIGAVSKGV